MKISLNLELKSPRKLFGSITYEDVRGEKYIVLSTNFKILEAYTSDKGIMSKIHLSKCKKIKYLTKSNVYSLAENIDNITLKYVNRCSFDERRHTNVLSKKIINLEFWCSKFYPKILLCDKNEIESTSKGTLNTGYTPATLKGFENYEVINGSDNVLLFQKEDAPYSIIAFHKNYVYKKTSGQISVYCRRKQELKHALYIATESNKILNWYNTFLYSKQPVLRDQTIISLSNKNLALGYMAADKDKMCLDTIRGEEEVLLYDFITHEYAHHWGSCNYDKMVKHEEACLAEGVAEWSSIAFNYYNKNENFQSKIDKYLKSSLMRNDLMLKSELENSKYCYSTHARGFLLYYDVYINYGIEKLIDCLRYYAYAETKSAEGMIIEMKKHESEEFSNYINDLVSVALSYSINAK